MGNYLADMATQLTAARQLVQYAARRYDSGERADMEAGMAKLFASETAMKIALDAVRIHLSSYTLGLSKGNLGSHDILFCHGSVGETLVEQRQRLLHREKRTVRVQPENRIEVPLRDLTKLSHEHSIDRQLGN